MSMEKATPGKEKFTDHPLRRWRKETGKALSSLAEEASITTAHLSQIEHRKGNCSLELALKLADITGLPVKDFHLPKSANADAE